MRWQRSYGMTTPLQESMGALPGGSRHLRDSVAEEVTPLTPPHQARVPGLPQARCCGAAWFLLAPTDILHRSEGALASGILCELAFPHFACPAQGLGLGIPAPPRLKSVVKVLWTLTMQGVKWKRAQQTAGETEVAGARNLQFCTHSGSPETKLCQNSGTWNHSTRPTDSEST
jgi:hypothetical protein